MFYYMFPSLDKINLIFDLTHTFFLFCSQEEFPFSFANFNNLKS